jgi:hypothetical protein
MGYEELDREVSYGMERNRLRVIRRYQLDNLVGRLLTYVEATYSDPQQRKAHKDIVKQLVYNWFMDVRIEGIGDDEIERLISKTLDNWFNGKCINCGNPDTEMGCSDCPPSRLKAVNVVVSKKMLPIPPKPLETSETEEQ